MNGGDGDEHIVHMQDLIKIVRDRRNAERQWGAALARAAERKRERDEKWAAAAPAHRAARERRRLQEEE